MLNITVLGCGSSLGVPVIGCDCDICCSRLPYNKRTRSSIYIDDGDSQILIDFGFDIKNQLIRENIKKLDGAILTHIHSDHLSGIDELRIFTFIQGKALKIFTDDVTAILIQNHYKHLFNPTSEKYKLVAVPMDFFAKFKIKTFDIQFFKQHHGAIDSLGIRIKDFVYSCDVSDFPEDSEKFLSNIKVWILDCMDYTSNRNHAGLDKVLEWNKKFKPKQIFLTNMRHTIDYYKIQEELPANIKPLYDGYGFTVL